MAKNTLGTLYLIPTTLGEMDAQLVLPQSVKTVVEKIDFFIVENEKSARKSIKAISPRKPQPGLKFFLLNKFTEPAKLPTFLTPCLNGHDVGILSDAGCPGIADPGAEVVKIAHEKNIKVVPLVGPSSILLALMASGLNGQNFAFNGYLPIDKAERKKEIKKLEKRSKDYGQAQLFIETPYRNTKMLEDLVLSLQPSTYLTLACDLTLPAEFIKTQPIAHWKNTAVDLDKRPCIFIVQA